MSSEKHIYFEMVQAKEMQFSLLTDNVFFFKPWKQKDQDLQVLLV